MNEDARRPALVAMGVVVALATFGMPSCVGGLPISLFLKERVGLSASALAAFGALSYAPWHLRPLAALAADAFPVLGARRRGYVVAGSAVAVLAWLLFPLGRGYGWLVATLGLGNLALTVGAAALGGLLVATARRAGAPGRVGPVRTVALTCADFAAGPVGGFLALRPLALTAAVGAAALSAAGFLASRLPEPLQARNADLARGLRAVLASRGTWVAVGMVVLVMASPGFGTPLLYYQRDVLRFSPVLLGWLGTLGSVGGLLGGLAYAAVCRRAPFRALLAVAVVGHSLATAAFLFYRSPASAAAVGLFGGVLGAFATAALVELAARAAPEGMEALGLAVVLTALELSATVSNLLGSWLYDRFHLTFLGLLWISAGTSLIAVVAVPFVPGALVRREITGFPG